MSMKPVNDYDISQANPTVPRLVWQSAQIMNGHQSGWWAIINGKRLGVRTSFSKHDIGKTRTAGTGIRRADGTRVEKGTHFEVADGDSQPCPFDTFAQASEAARTHGASGEWKRATGRSFGNMWFAADAPNMDGLKWGKPGTPCGTTVKGEVVNNREGCNRYTVDGTLMCKMHTNAKATAAANDEARDARNAEMRAGWKREAESEKAAAETLAKIGPLLADLGLHPETFEVVKGGKIAVPHEALYEMVRMAGEYAKMAGELGI